MPQDRVPAESVRADSAGGQQFVVLDTGLSIVSHLHRACRT